jgi:hypothetical protein
MHIDDERGEPKHHRSEKHRQVLGQQHILIQQNLPPRNLPCTVNFP